MRWFEKLALVCREHELDLQLHADLLEGKRTDRDARYGLAVLVLDGADGKQMTSADGAEELEAAAEHALGKLRRAGVVP